MIHCIFAFLLFKYFLWATFRDDNTSIKGLPRSIVLIWFEAGLWKTYLNLICMIWWSTFFTWPEPIHSDLAHTDRQIQRETCWPVHTGTNLAAGWLRWLGGGVLVTRKGPVMTSLSVNQQLIKYFGSRPLKTTRCLVPTCFPPAAGSKCKTLRSKIYFLLFQLANCKLSAGLSSLTNLPVRLIL